MIFNVEELKITWFITSRILPLVKYSVYIYTILILYIFWFFRCISFQIANTKSPETGEGKNRTPLESPEEDQSEETDVTRLFGTKQIHCHKCSKCETEVHKESILLLCNLIYPLLGTNGLFLKLSFWNITIFFFLL